MFRKEPETSNMLCILALSFLNVSEFVGCEIFILCNDPTPGTSISVVSAAVSGANGPSEEFFTNSAITQLRALGSLERDANDRNLCVHAAVRTMAKEGSSPQNCLRNDRGPISGVCIGEITKAICLYCSEHARRSAAVPALGTFFA